MSEKLIGACIFGMLYTGGIMEGKSIADAFADCDSAKALVLSSFISFVFVALLYLPRGVLRFDQFCECFVLGFRAMVPAVFILCLLLILETRNKIVRIDDQSAVSLQQGILSLNHHTSM